MARRCLMRAYTEGRIRNQTVIHRPMRRGENAGGGEGAVCPDWTPYQMDWKYLDETIDSYRVPREPMPIRESPSTAECCIRHGNIHAAYVRSLS